MDAEAAEYLRAVRAEAARLPSISAGTRHTSDATVDCTNASEDTSSTAHVPPPPEEWWCTVIDNFVTARAQVQSDIAARTALPAESAERVPHAGDRRGWHKYILQEDAQPFSAVLARLDNTLAAGCLKHLANETAAVDAAWPANAQRGLWMYGLMVRLEKPLHPDVACALHKVATLAAQHRAGLPQV